MTTRQTVSPKSPRNKHRKNLSFFFFISLLWHNFCRHRVFQRIFITESTSALKCSAVYYFDCSLRFRVVSASIQKLSCRLNSQSKPVNRLDWYWFQLKINDLYLNFEIFDGFDKYWMIDPPPLKKEKRANDK